MDDGLLLGLVIFCSGLFWGGMAKLSNLLEGWIERWKDHG